MKKRGFSFELISWPLRSINRLMELVSDKNSVLSFAIIFGLIVLLIGFFYIRAEVISKKKAIENELATVAKLKIKQISDWMADEREDSYLLANGNLRKEKIEEWLISKAEADSISLSENLEISAKLHGMEGIYLVSLKGDLLIATRPSEFENDMHLSNTIKKCIETGKQLNTDIYRCSIHGKVHFDLVVPVFDKKGVQEAVMVFRHNPEKFIFPLLIWWPGIYKSAETLIVRKDNDSVQFLNSLKFDQNNVLSIKKPLAMEDLPAAEVLKGRQGVFYGKDYRNKRVISWLQKIPGTNWAMVAKIDQKEIFHDLKKETVMMIIIVLFFIILLFFGLSGLYAFSQRNIFRELWKTQEEYKTTLYSIGDAVITTDSSGIVKYLNSVAEKLTGWTEKEATGMQIEEVFKIINEDSRQKVENPVKKVLESGLVLGLANHTLLVSKNGTEYPIADSGAPIKDDSGEILGVVLVFRDQTSERENQKKLLQSEFKYHTLFDHAPIGYQSLNKDGSIIEVNQMWLNTLGYERDEVIGHWFGQFLIPEQQGIFRQLFTVNIQRKDMIKDVEFHLLKKNGEVVIADYNARIGFDDHGEFVQTHCIFRDITEKVLAEKAKKENEELFKTILYSIGDAIIITNTRSQIINMNPVAEELTGWKELEAKGKQVDEVFVIKDEYTDEPVENPVIEVLREGQIVGLANHTILISKDGNEIPIADSGAPLKDENGKITGVVLVFRNQSEERLIEKLTNIRLNLFDYSTKHSFREICTQTLDEIEKLVKSKIGFYHTVDDDQETLTLQAWSTRTKNEFCLAEGEGLHYKVSEAGVWVECVNTKQPVIHNDYDSLPGKKGMPEGHARVIRELIVPVRRKDKIVAILGVGNKETPYTEKDVELVSYMADMLFDIADEKRMEEAISVNEQKFRNLAENAPGVISYIDKEGIFRVSTGQGLKEIGLEQHQVEGLSVYEIYKGNPVLEVIRKALTGIQCTEIATVQNDQIFETVFTPVFDKNNEVLGIINFALNITDRKKAEQDLIQSEERFRNIFENASVGKSLTFPSGEIVVNNAFCEMIGYSQEELKNVKWMDITHPDDVEHDIQQVEQLLNGEKEKNRWEKRYLHKDGNSVWVDINTVLQKDNEGKPLYFITTIQNITNQKMLLEELSESEKKFSVAFQSSPVAMTLTLVKDSTYKDINIAFLHETGYSKDEVIGHTPEELGIFEDPAVRKRLVDEVLLNGSIYGVSFKAVKKDGQIIDCLLSTNLVTIGNEKFFLSSLTNITPQKLAEQKLTEKVEELQRWYSATLGREERNIELKKEINNLLQKAGLPPKYKNV